MQNEERAQIQLQPLKEKLEDIAGRINELRGAAWVSARVLRGTVRPAIDKIIKHPRPFGILQPMGKSAEEVQPAQQVEIKQAEPKPTEPKPIFPGLWDLISTKPKQKVEAPQVEVEPKPAESEPPRWSRYKRPDQPALL